ncbi:hypothetical protein ACFX2V_10965 [Gilliamella apicola]|uniref:hypothetical protein n=1 Tax=Gilliamella apicola TaxID=1196095 RepID=UPI003987DA3D
MNNNIISKLTANIKEHHYSLEIASRPFKTPEKMNNFNKLSYDDWCNSVFGDGLVKIRLFTENNFNFIETVGLVSVTRYIFELSVWLKLFIKEPHYGFVYYHQLIRDQLQYWMSLKAQMKREIDFSLKLKNKKKKYQNFVGY